MRKLLTTAAAVLALSAPGAAFAQHHDGGFSGGHAGSFHSGGFRGGDFRGGGYRGGGYGYRGGYGHGGYGWGWGAGAIGFGLGAALAAPYYYDYPGYYYDEPAYGCGYWAWDPYAHRQVWVDSCDY
ncbi:MAG TPA: hypothetical protein VJP88_07390 [Caulobacteraceae bacterium]|nr:hypothetical protein [Caulobacteraceae bacterium]